MTESIGERRVSAVNVDDAATVAAPAGKTIGHLRVSAVDIDSAQNIGAPEGATLRDILPGGRVSKEWTEKAVRARGDASQNR